MSVTGFVVLAIAVWATFASVRTIQRIGLRQFSVVIARRGWAVSKVLLRGTWIVVGAMFAAAASRSDDDEIDAGLIGPDLMDGNDIANSGRPESPWYSGDHFDDKKEGEV